MKIINRNLWKLEMTIKPIPWRDRMSGIYIKYYDKPKGGGDKSGAKNTRQQASKVNQKAG